MSASMFQLRICALAHLRPVSGANISNRNSVAAAAVAAAAEAYANRDAKTLSSRWGEEEVARVTALPSKPDAWAMEYADAALSKLDELEVKYSSKTDA